MDIPDDLRQYLTVPTNRSLRFADGEVSDLTLYSPEELKESVFRVSTADFALQEGWEGWDTMPHERYAYRGVDLVKSCDGYGPEGIMVWFPELGAYGQWDCDHHKIIVFVGLKWSDILKDPQRYFNAQWYPERVSHNYLRPWEDE